MKIVIHFIKRDDDCLFVIHLKFTFSDNIKAVVSQVPVFRSRAALQLRKAAFTRHSATRLCTSLQTRTHYCMRVSSFIKKLKHSGVCNNANYSKEV